MINLRYNSGWRAGVDVGRVINRRKYSSDNVTDKQQSQQPGNIRSVGRRVLVKKQTFNDKPTRFQKPIISFCCTLTLDSY